MDRNALAARARRAAICIEDYMDVKPGEHVLITRDKDIDPAIAEFLWDEARRRGAHPYILAHDPVNQNEIPPAMAKAMYGADVLIMVNRILVMHREASNRAIYQYGARCIEVHACDMEEFTEPWMLVHPRDLEKLVRRTESIIAGGCDLHVTADNGTDFRVSFRPIDIGGQPGFGHGTDPGTWVHWPHGSLYMTPPIEATSNGTLVCDIVQTLDDFVVPERPVTLEIRDSWVTRVEGGKEAQMLREQYERYPNDNFFNEVALEHNPLIPNKYDKNPFVVMRRAGLIYFGFGNSKTFGYHVRAPHHTDHGILHADVSMNGRKIVEKGQLVALQQLLAEGRKFAWEGD